MPTLHRHSGCATQDADCRIRASTQWRSTPPDAFLHAEADGELADGDDPLHEVATREKEAATSVQTRLLKQIEAHQGS